MQKESLEVIKEKLVDLLNNTNIDTIDKIELLINLNCFLSEYDENIKILRREKNGTNKI